MTGNQRKRLLQEWRLIPEKEPGRPAQLVGNLLEKQMAELGLKERMLEDQLTAAWEETVGQATAGFSRPVQLKRAQLIVAVSQPTLLYDLERFHKPEILRRLQEKFGAAVIRDIRFRVGN